MFLVLSSLSWFIINILLSGRGNIVLLAIDAVLGIVVIVIVIVIVALLWLW